MSTRFIKNISKKAGLAPGTLVHVGKERSEKVKITVIDYDKDHLDVKEIENIEECFSYKDSPTVSWINIDGVHDMTVIEKIGKHFGLHPLVQEDIVNTGQRPKSEDFENYVFVVLKMLYNNEKNSGIVAEQVSLILGQNFVISFQEQKGDVFDAIRERIRKAKGRIRREGPDYLTYALLDAIVDNYFLILEGLGEKIEKIEGKLVNNPTPKTLQAIHGLKGDTVFLRKSIWPLREVTSSLAKCESSLIKETTGIYLRDVYEHTIQVIDTVEAFRDMISGILDIYLSSISNRMNEVMKVLTIFAALFIPLTFIAGVYGMNFKYMPELEWHWAYFAVLGLMAATAGALLMFFKRKKWF
ncbi:magnesium/cobalt transporter CorA [Candidatus Omnitrophota bacterium]